MLCIFSRTSASTNDPFCGIGMGDKVKDTLTGFTGVVTARAEYLTGCNQLYVQPQSEKDNEIKRGEWLDIERVEKIADKAVEIASRPGGSDIPAPRVGGGRL